MTDTPEKLGYEQRRIGTDRNGRARYESIPRTKSSFRDKALFDSLTFKQEQAYNLIDQARNYELTGLPQVRMKFSDAPSGGDYELTPGQLQVVLDYREWRQDVYRDMPAVLYAVIQYIRGMGLMEIEEALQIGHGKAARYISMGLNRYCLMKKWGDQERGLNLRRVRVTGYAAELTRFSAEYFDELGRPVADFRAGQQEEEGE
jgi:hypothetical protein